MESTATHTVSGGHAQGDVASTFEAITGTAYADSLIGNAAVNIFLAGAGNDTMSGLAAKDRLYGQAHTFDGGGGTDFCDEVSGETAVSCE